MLSKKLSLLPAIVLYPNLKADLTCPLLGDALPDRLLPSRLKEMPLFDAPMGPLHPFKESL